jgi:hypothetical protein
VHRRRSRRPLYDRRDVARASECVDVGWGLQVAMLGSIARYEPAAQRHEEQPARHAARPLLTRESGDSGGLRARGVHSGPHLVADGEPEFQVMRRMAAVIRMPMIGSRIGTPTATAPAAAITASDT